MKLVVEARLQRPAPAVVVDRCPGVVAEIGLVEVRVVEAAADIRLEVQECRIRGGEVGEVILQREDHRHHLEAAEPIAVETDVLLRPGDGAFDREARREEVGGVELAGPLVLDFEAGDRGTDVRVDVEDAGTEHPPTPRCCGRRHRSGCRGGGDGQRSGLKVGSLHLIAHRDPLELFRVPDWQNDYPAARSAQRNGLVSRIDGDDVGNDHPLAGGDSAGSLAEFGARFGHGVASARR